jgi:ParB family chromosome partitioning protein
MASPKSGRKSGLGRGLESLIPVERPDAGFTTIPLDRISPNPQQPREYFDEEALEGLAASIQEVGVLQPIVVHGSEEEGYTLIAGERRWRAARLAGLDEVPAVVRAADAESSLVEALIENLQREDLGPLEEAAAFQELVSAGLSHEAVADRVGKSRPAVSNTLRLLELPPAIQGQLERGELGAGHARALLGIDDEAYAVHIGQRASVEGWSVRQVEEAVSARRPEPAAAKRRRPPERPAAIIDLEERLGEQLGAAVRIDYGARGGKLVVRFKSVDDLERIYKQFLS